MIVSGHQPAYLPWLGLLHKASLCDVFVYMDDVQYLTQDWNNRNRVIGRDGRPFWLTVPVDLKGSSSRLLKDIRIAPHRGKPSQHWQASHWQSLRTCYGKTKYFAEYAPFFEWLYLDNEWSLLSELNLAVLDQALDWFGLAPQLVIGSEEGFTSSKSDLVLEHAQRFEADTVVTGTHGRDYIRAEDFAACNITVFFQDYRHPQYRQGHHDFVPYLSFVDLLFRYGPDSREVCLDGNIAKEAL